MEIVLSGTKGGYGILYAKNKALVDAYLLDIRAVSPKSEAIGKSAYAIRFVKEKTIFSKYHIVRDVLGDSRTGFIGFSVLIDKGKKLSGKDIVRLLDEVSKTYFEKYIENDKLGSHDEQWGFINQIAEKYQTYNTDNPLNLISKAEDSAYLYFKKTADVSRYFEEPFQKEYEKFRQVLFINESLKESSKNILNAIRHSSKADLTGINIEKYYTICVPKDKKGVEIKSEPNEPIHKGSSLKITYSKPNYKDVVKELNWSDGCSEFVEVDDKNRRLNIKLIEPSEPKKRTFSLKPTGFSSSRKSEPTISCENVNNSNKSKEIKENKITFIGEELGEEWEIRYEKGGCKGGKSITPNKEGSIIQIPLTKKIDIDVKDEDGKPLIEDVDIKIKDEQGESYTIFEVDKRKTLNLKKAGRRYTITIKKEGYSTFKKKEVDLDIDRERSFTLKRGMSFFYKNGKLIASITATVLVVALIAFAVLNEFFIEKENKNPVTEQPKDTTETVQQTDTIRKEKESIPQNLNGAGGGSKKQDKSKGKGKKAKKKTKEEKNKDKQLTNAKDDKYKDIENKLKQEKVEKAELENLKKNANKRLKASIDLYLRFWNVTKPIGEDPNQDSYEKILEYVKKDPILKDSKLKTVLEKLKESEKYGGMDKRRAFN